ncbi:MAG TPA: hypothetical protein VE032_08440 [Actinomycetota bacterium]|nr:hypothetical protein [Actinomycetota bacterium]
MGCLFAILAGFMPRVAAILFWVFRPGRWDLAFDGAWIWPILGIIFLPITTIIWVIVAPGGVQGLDFLWLGTAVVFDAGWAGGAARRRARSSG